MSPVVRAATASITAAVLLAQAVFPGLVLGTSCPQSFSPSCSVESSKASGCCCSQSESDSSSVQSHCQQPSHHDQTQRYDLPVCHCGNSYPAQPVCPSAPESSIVSSLTDRGCGDTSCLTTASVVSSAAKQGQVASRELLVPHFKQILQCVWLT